MEIIIIICLLIVIGLLLDDKISITCAPTKSKRENSKNNCQPGIIGQSKEIKRRLLPNQAHGFQEENPMPEDNNFHNEIIEKDYKRQVPQEELDEIFSPVDLEEEEEEWRLGISDGDDGLAQGVTFEELSTVGMVLREEIQEPALQQKAVEVVHKIQGTELFALLENSTEDASRRIAELLDRRLSLQVGSGTISRKNLDGFEIGDFV